MSDKGNSVNIGRLCGLCPPRRVTTARALWSTRFADGVVLATVAMLETAFLASCAPLSSRITADPGPAISRLQSGGSIQEEVDRLAQPLIDSGEVYGIAVGVLTPDGSYRSYGYGGTGHRGRLQAPTGDTIFQIGSLSKVLVASLLAILVKEGALHYEETVRSIVPSDIPLSESAAEVTLYDLVTNTSGLPREPQGFLPVSHLIDYLFTGSNLYSYINRPYLYEYLRTCHLPPKTQRTHLYSNLGMALLAHLIELKTNRAFPDLLQEKICRPLKMRDTVFLLTAEQRKRLAVGHVGDQPRFMRRGAPLPPWEMGEIMQATGGLYSTVDDLMIFAKSNLGMLGHPLDPVIAETHRVQFKTPADDVAFGWLIDDWVDERERIIYMHGMVAGYVAYAGMNTAKGLAVVVLCNSFNWDDKIAHNLILQLSKALESSSSLVETGSWQQMNSPIEHWAEPSPSGCVDDAFFGLRLSNESWLRAYSILS